MLPYAMCYLPVVLHFDMLTINDPVIAINKESIMLIMLTLFQVNTLIKLTFIFHEILGINHQLCRPSIPSATCVWIRVTLRQFSCCCCFESDQTCWFIYRSWCCRRMTFLNKISIPYNAEKTHIQRPIERARFAVASTIMTNSWFFHLIYSSDNRDCFSAPVGSRRKSLDKCQIS